MRFINTFATFSPAGQKLAQVWVLGFSATMSICCPLFAQQTHRPLFSSEAAEGVIGIHRSYNAAVPLAAAGNKVNYSVVSIPVVAGRNGSTMPEPRSINNAGVAAGYSFAGPFEPGPQFYNSTVGFVYARGTLTTLPLLPGYPAAFAFGLNDANQVFGEATGEDLNGVVYKTAVLWDHGVPINLGTVIPNSISFASGVNNLGVVAANSISNDTGLQTAFAWKKGQRVQLAVPDGVIQSSAHWINDAGQIAGALDYGPDGNGFDDIRACLWTVRNGTWTPQDLGLLPGGQDYSLANFINNRSQVVGYAVDANEYEQAFFQFGGPLQQLPHLPGGTFGSALSLNEHGQIAGGGDRSDGNIVPIVWQKGSVVDLNDLVPAGTPLLIGGGGGINEHGEITSTVLNADGTFQAVILQPVNPN